MKQAAIQLLQEDCARVAQDHLADLDLLSDATLFVTGGTGFMGGWISELVCHLNDHHHKPSLSDVQLLEVGAAFQDLTDHHLRKPNLD